MALFKTIFGAIHPTMTFIILIINVSLFLGVLSLVNYIQKNANKWISTAEKKVNDKVDEFRKKSWYHRRVRWTVTVELMEV